MRSSMILACLPALLAGATATAMERLESLRSTPRHWSLTGEPSPSEKLHFQISVADPDEDGKVANTLYDVSTPGNSNYGKHLSLAQYKAMSQGRPESKKAIVSWLEQSGVPKEDIHEDGDWIDFTAPASVANKMMDTKFNLYRSNLDSSIERVRALHYSVPSDLTEHISIIHPTTDFGPVKNLPYVTTTRRDAVAAGIQHSDAASDALPASCAQTKTPECLIDLYNIRGYTPDPRFGFASVTGFGTNVPYLPDVRGFVNKFGSSWRNTNFSLIPVDGPLASQNPQLDHVEADLDIEMTMSLTNPMHNKFYYVNHNYISLSRYLLNLEAKDLPLTLSTSYSIEEQQLTSAYMKTVCNLFAKLGARGVSVIFSSGDSGPGASQTADCPSDGNGPAEFQPQFPPTCPFVTAVGGTQSAEPEVVWSAGNDSSSGGFSTLFSQPSYQSSVVKKYIQSIGSENKGLYDATKRAFPDVAAVADSCEIFTEGALHGVGGTSCASPVFAAVIARVNNALRSKGKPTLGFLNPWLYSSAYPAQALNDITQGKSQGCKQELPNAGWTAAPGWDAATGLGTPNFQKLLQVALNNGTHYRV